MHATMRLSALSLALSSNVFAAPLAPRQEPLILADTVQFIAKTFGRNPNTTLPNINNYLFVPVHSGAGMNLMTLVDPATTSFNLSQPGYFLNGTDEVHGGGGYMTAGYLEGTTTPYSLVRIEQPDGSGQNGAAIGPFEFNVGVGTNGINLVQGQLITDRYTSDTYSACANTPVEGGTVISIQATDRYARPPVGCWRIQLLAQCAGPISGANKAAFPGFVKSGCFANATKARLDPYFDLYGNTGNGNDL